MLQEKVDKEARPSRVDTQNSNNVEICLSDFVIEAYIVFDDL